MKAQESLVDYKPGTFIRLFRCGFYSDIQYIWSSMFCSCGWRASANIHRSTVAEAGGITCGYIQGCVLIQVHVSLRIFLGVSYWSLHQNHAENNSRLPKHWWCRWPAKKKRWHFQFWSLGKGRHVFNTHHRPWSQSGHVHLSSRSGWGAPILG